MRTANSRGVMLLMLVLLCGLHSSVAGSQAKPQPKAADMNVLTASIRGISLGMSPRRVLLELQKNKWTYGRSSTDTLEDVIERNPSLTSIYLDLSEPATSDQPWSVANSIAVHFAWDNASTEQLRVVMICHTYDAPIAQYAATLQAAKAHLDSLGGFKEKITEEPKFEHRLTYQKIERSYIMYQVVKLSCSRIGHRVPRARQSV